MFVAITPGVRAQILKSKEVVPGHVFKVLPEMCTVLGVYLSVFGYVDDITMRM